MPQQAIKIHIREEESARKRGRKAEKLFRAGDPSRENTKEESRNDSDSREELKCRKEKKLQRTERTVRRKKELEKKT